MPAVETVELDSAPVETGGRCQQRSVRAFRRRVGDIGRPSVGSSADGSGLLKVLRSATNPDLVYPTDGCAHVPDSFASTAVLRDVPMGQWLRVCAVKEDAWISCSSVVRMAPWKRPIAILKPDARSRSVNGSPLGIFHGH